jgi:hypothetical protein
VNPPTFKCGKCGADALCEPPDAPAVCPACCEDHDYVYHRGEGRMCTHCSAEPPLDYYDCDYDESR